MNQFRRSLMVQNKGEIKIPDYFCFTALEDSTFTLTIPQALPNSVYNYVEYSIDNGTSWTKTNNQDDTQIIVTTPTILANNKVLWRGLGTILGNNSYTYSNFSSTGRFDVSGHIQSLYHLNDIENSTVTSYKYARLFYGCTKLVSAKNLILPAATEASSHLQMFQGCSNLLYSPVLPALRTNINSYRELYYSCGSLTRIINYSTSYASTNGYYQWTGSTNASTKVPSTCLLVCNYQASTTHANNIKGNCGSYIFYDIPNDKYYLSDKTTECDENGNVI